MSIKRILSFVLALAMCFSLISTGVAFADGEQTVTFDPNNGEASYTVDLDTEGKVSAPDAPSKADDDEGYRYEFTGWRVNGVAVTFPIEATPGTVFKADYEQYLANDYTFMIEHSGGVAYLQDYTTPISTLKAGYSGITRAVPVMLQRGTISSTDVAEVNGEGYESLEEALAAISTVTTEYHNKSDITITKYLANGTVTLDAAC